MVDVSDIEDSASLEAWLEDQPREVAIWIASRAAARVLPLWWDEVLSEDWALDADITSLQVLRCLLISTLAAEKHSAEIQAAARTASRFQTTTRPSGVTAASSSRAALVAADAVTSENPRSATIAVATAAVRTQGIWDEVRQDAYLRQRSEAPDASPLWARSKAPFEESWVAIKRQVANSEGSEDWRFWTQWYDALLDGRPMLGDAARTWEMLEEIALIDPATWDKGPEVVNPVIRGIWELHRLRTEVAALQGEKAAFLAARASEAQRGHNQPPEGLVDDAPEVARQITIIWDGLDEAREELERDAPDKGVLRAIAERMLAALNAVVAYCGKVGDAAVMSAATETGKLAARTAYVATLDHIVNNGRLTQFVRDLLAYGLGG